MQVCSIHKKAFSSLMCWTGANLNQMMPRFLKQKGEIFFFIGCWCLQHLFLLLMTSWRLVPATETGHLLSVLACHYVVRAASCETCSGAACMGRCFSQSLLAWGRAFWIPHIQLHHHNGSFGSCRVSVPPLKHALMTPVSRGKYPSLSLLGVAHYIVSSSSL